METTSHETPAVINEQTSSHHEAPRRYIHRHRHAHKKAWFAVMLVVSLVAGFSGALIALVALPKIQAHMPTSWHMPFTTPSKPSALNTSPTIDTKNLVAEDDAIIATVDASSKAVVSIVISQDVPKLQRGLNSPFGFPFFMNPQDMQGGNANGSGTEKQTVGQGSGFLVSADGLIVTNKHVVSATAASYTVITTDGKEFVAQILAQDPNRDIALLKIDAKDMPFLELGNSDDVKVGQTAIAIGNSLGEFTNTVSKGIISGLKRDLVAGSGRGDNEHLSNIIQTDAAINPGNSGGPLLDISGKVIGVNVAMAQGAQSIGFALPANQIKKIINQVQSTGRITTAFLGVRYIIINKDIQKENSLPLAYGALILRGEKMTDFAVIPGSPADKAGLMENDIIAEIDGVKIEDAQQISDIVADHQPGDTLMFTVLHKGETKTITIQLEEKK